VVKLEREGNRERKLVIHALICPQVLVCGILAHHMGAMNVWNTGNVGMSGVTPNERLLNVEGSDPIGGLILVVGITSCVSIDLLMANLFSIAIDGRTAGVDKSWFPHFYKPKGKCFVSTTSCSIRVIISNIFIESLALPFIFGNEVPTSNMQEQALDMMK